MNILGIKFKQPVKCFSCATEAKALDFKAGDEDIELICSHCHRSILTITIEPTVIYECAGSSDC
jgi:hypothetical protein